MKCCNRGSRPAARLEKQGVYALATPPDLEFDRTDSTE
jgi:hypothetical protein